MQLKILGSSSAGNCMLLENDTETLILEAGIPFKKVKQALNFDVSKVVAAVISHGSHGDHGCAALDMLQSGIDCYTGSLEWAAMGIKHHRAKPLESGKVIKLGNFSILPFPVMHDSPQAQGYYIRHNEIGNTLFITDTYYVPTKFANINNIIIECNYSFEILRRKFKGQELDAFLKNRIISSHLSLETLLDLLKANDLSKCHSITLCHLSNGNSDAVLFQKTVEEATGIPTSVADTGMVIENFGHRNAFV